MVEIYYHDYALSRRLEVMAHYRLLPSQVKELTDDELEAMAIGYRLYEKRNIESLSDLIGSLTGTVWNADALTSDSKKDDLDTYRFTWKKRPDRKRISLPLTVVVGGNKVMEHVKKVALEMKAKERKDPSILSLPSSTMLHNAEVVDLSRVAKEEFIRFAKGVK